MNERDRDLIIALIEGSLSEQDAGEASARISTDPELASEYEIQRSIHEALSAVEPVSMTTSERSTLHANLIEQLHLEESVPVPAPRSSGRWSAWWLRPAVAVGSVAAVFVLGVAVIPGILSGSADEGGEELAAAVATTTVASADSGGADGSGDTAETPTEADEPTSRLLEVPEFESPDLDEILDSVADTPSDESIVEEAEVFALPEATVLVSSDTVEDCREQLGTALPEGDFHVIGADQEDSGAIVVTIAFADADGVEVLANIDLETCVLVDLAE